MYASLLKDNDDNNGVCDVKHIAIYANHFTTRSQVFGIP